MVLKTLKWPVLFCYLTLLNCREDNLNISVFPIDTKMAPFLFDTGSLWIYKNATTLQTDTEIVVSAKRMNIYKKGATLLCWNMIFKNLTTREERSYDIVYQGWWEKFQDKALMENNSNRIVDSNKVNYYSRQIQLLDSMYINGKLYRNIRRFRVEAYPDSAANTYNQYFIADSIGIIRWDQFNKGVNTGSKFLIDYRIKLAPNWNSP
jgi:hypothetical protein